jgi:hypothetical protein
VIKDIDRKGSQPRPVDTISGKKLRPDHEIRSQLISKLAGLEVARANMDLDLHLLTPFLFCTSEKLPTLDGAASANVDLDLHLLTPFLPF